MNLSATTLRPPPHSSDIRVARDQEHLQMRLSLRQALFTHRFNHNLLLRAHALGIPLQAGQATAWHPWQTHCQRFVLEFLAVANTSGCEGR
jgi:hypothetical protein